jgi:hypothetical protein
MCAAKSEQGGMAQGWNCYTVEWPMLRASFATHLFESGSDLSAVLGTGRHSNRSGTAGPSLYQKYDTLYPCPFPRSGERAQSAGRNVIPFKEGYYADPHNKPWEACLEGGIC